MTLSLEEKHQILNHLNYAYLRILPHLQQQAPYLWTVESRLNPAEYYGGMAVPLMFEESDIFARCDRIQSEFVVNEIRSIVADLHAIDEAIKKEQMSPNGALVKADKLEWNQEARTAGMRSRRDSRIERLRYHLKLPPSPPVSYGTILDRS